MREIKIGVHQSHCCVLHGCKYGKDSECPVVKGDVRQDYICESCDMDDIKDVDEIDKYLSLNICCDELKSYKEKSYNPIEITRFKYCPYCGKLITFKK